MSLVAIAATAASPPSSTVFASPSGLLLSSPLSLQGVDVGSTLQSLVTTIGQLQVIVADQSARIAVLESTVSEQAETIAAQGATIASQAETLPLVPHRR